MPEGTIYALFVLSAITALLILFLGLRVFLHNRKNLVNLLFVGLTFSSFVWIAGVIIRFYLQGELVNLVGARISFAGATFVGLFIFYFTYYFPQRNNYRVWHSIVISFSVAIFGLSLFTPFVIKAINYLNGIQINVSGPGYYLFSIYFFSCLIIGFYNAISKYKKLSPQKAAQNIYVLIGLGATIAIALTTNLIFPLLGTTTYSKYGPLANIFFIVFTSYAIIKHRLMDIRFVLRRWSVVFLSWATIILIIVLIKYSYFNFSPIPIYGADYLFIILGIVLYPSISSRYYHLANKYFFTSLYDPQQVIAELSDKLSSTLRLDKIYKYVSASLVASLHAHSIQIYIFNKKSKKYELSYYHGNQAVDQKAFTEDQGFYSNYLQKNIPIIIDELRKKVYVPYRRTIDHLQSQKVEIIIPLHLKDRTIGIIALGHKESHDIYNDEDVKLLEIIGAQSAIAVDNAINYEEVRNFSKKLQVEIEHATKDLTRANAKLKQLDQAKSEFVSIASHQLRTPLTVIKGYISMFLEGSFGKMEGIQKDSMEKVYHSNERLIQLVENLLNISRIESGRLRVDKEPINLIEMIAGVVEELSGPAEKKGLKLEFTRLKKDVIIVQLDQEKIRQVILNLIDNSIKYTKKGKIKIRIEKQKNNILLCVSDKGMGIKPDDLIDLFEKFSRGTGTALVHTEGTGLGLYVAKQMVEAHGGKIWAESRGKNKGSKFCFTLPFRDKDKNK